MKVKTDIPNTNNIAFDGGVITIIDPQSIQRDADFSRGTEFDSFSPITSGNANISYNPLYIDKTIPAGVATAFFFSNYQFDSSKPFSISLDLETYDYSSTTGSVFQVNSFGSDEVVRMIFENGPQNQIRFTWDDGVTSDFYVIPINDTKGTLILTYTGSNIYCIFLDRNRKEYYSPMIPFEFTGMVDTMLEYIPGVLHKAVSLFKFEALPVVRTGVLSHNAPYPIPLSKTPNSVAFRVLPGGPSLQQCSYSDLEQANPSQIFYINFLNSLLSEKTLKLMASAIDNIEDDFNSPAVCPRASIPDSSNIGSLGFINRCFCDGSEEDARPIDIKISKNSQTNLNQTRNLAEMVITDGETTYGCDPEFLRIHQQDPSLQIPEGRYIKVLRTLVTSDNKRIYYGVHSGSDEPIHVGFDLEYEFSQFQLSVPEQVVDRFYWEIEDEAGNILQNSTTITILNYTNPALQPVSAILPQGRYTLKITASGFPGAYENSDGGFSLLGKEDTELMFPKLYATITDLDTAKTIATAFAEFRAVSTFFHSTGVCYINFEIRNPKGKLFAYVFDPCEQTIQYFEQPEGDNVNLRTNSVALVEYSQGFIFLNEFIDFSHNFYESRNQSLRCRNFSLDTGFEAFTSTLTIKTDLTTAIHAFDAVCQDDILHIYYSMRNIEANPYISSLVNMPRDFLLRDNTNPTTASRQLWRSAPFWPIGPNKIITMTYDLKDISFQGVSRQLVSESVPQPIFPKALQTMLVFRNDAHFGLLDGAGTSDFALYPMKSFKWVFASTIKTNLDKDQNLLLLSMLDENVRIGTVFMGGVGPNLKECVLPLHFDSRIILNTVLRDDRSEIDPRIPIDRPDFRFNSLSACLDQSNMVSTVATSGELIEHGLHDPLFLFENQDNLYTLTDQYDAEVFQSPFNSTFVSIGAYDKKLFNFKAVADINRHLNYNIITTCISDVTTYPTIYQNNTPSEAPNRSMSLMAVSPDTQDAPDIVTFLSASRSLSGNCINIIDNDPIAFGPETYVQILLDRTTALWSKYYDLNTGFRFTTTFGFEDDYLNPYHEPFIEVVGSDNYEDPTDLAHLRVKLTPLTLSVEYYDGSDWNLIFGPVEFNPRSIFQYNIYMRKTSDTHFKAALLIKTVPENATLDYRTEVVLYHLFDEIPLILASPNAETIMKTGYLVNSFSNNVLELYQMGITPLASPTGFFERELVELLPIPSVFNYYTEYRSGGTIRQYSDANYLSSQDIVQGFQFSILPISNLSNSFHWFNGFSFRATGRIANFNDTNRLQRFRITNSSYAMSSFINGFTITENDDTDVYIWSDSLEGNISTFIVDSFVVKGINSRLIDIVAKDLPGDAWEVIDTIDTRVYTISGSTTIPENGFASLANSEWNFPHDMLSSGTFYYYDDLADRAFKIVSNVPSQFTIETGEALSLSGEGYIFSTLAYKKLSEPIIKRLVGFKIQTFNTAEGYFTINAVDFGNEIAIPIIENNDVGTGLQYTQSNAKEYVVDGQAFTTNLGTFKASYNLTYNLADAKTYAKFMSVSNSVSFNRRPIWVIESQAIVREVHLTLLDGSINSNIIRDEEDWDGSTNKIYQISLSLRGVDR